MQTIRYEILQARDSSISKIIRRISRYVRFLTLNVCPGRGCGSGQFTVQGYYFQRFTSASYEYFKHCAAAQRPKAFERWFESRGGPKMRKFIILVFWLPRAGAIWRTSLRASSLDIEYLKLGLCANDPL